MLSPELESYASRLAAGEAPSAEDRLVIKSMRQVNGASREHKSLARESLRSVIDAMTAPPLAKVAVNQ